MLLSTLLLLPLLPLSLGFADPDLHARSRSRMAHRDILGKRQGFGGRATFYDVGLGACGGYNVASDFIVALNAPQFGGGYPGPNCGRALTISHNGKTTTAVVRDQCPGCGYGDLDMSRGLFNFFASEDVGTFQMSWSWADSPAPAPAPSTTQAPPPPTTTSTYVAPTSTYTPPPPTTSSPAYTPSSSSTTSSTAPPSSSSTAAPSSSTTTSSSASASSASASASRSVSLSSLADVVASVGPTSTGAPAPVQTGVAEGAGNLVLFNQAVANLGRVVVVGAQI